MANYLKLSFVVFTVVFHQVYCVPSLGAFMPAYPGYPGYGYDKRPVTLTCAVNFTDYKIKSGIVNAITVTIKEKSGSYGGLKSSLLSSVGYGTSAGLTATIDIFSAHGGAVAVAFTERGKPERGCLPDDFGHFLAPKSDISGLGGYAGTGAGYGGYSIGSYGGYGTYGGYGSYGGYGNAGGLGQGSAGYGYGAGLGGLGGFGGYPGAGLGGGYGPSVEDYSEDVPGVVAKVKLAPNTASSINIDNLSGYSQLKELAGRGVVVCPAKAVRASYMGAECEGGILSCCTLHYDQGEQYLGSAPRSNGYY